MPESLSYDGRWFGYLNGREVVLLDRSSGTSVSISRALAMPTAPSISGDGNRLLFGAEGYAFVWDRVTDGMLATFPVAFWAFGALSHDGRFLTFSTGDATFSDPPPFHEDGSVVIDLSTNERWQASVNDRGEAGDDISRSVDVSDDGQRVVFHSVALNLVPGKTDHRWDIFLYDHATRRTELVATAMNGGYPDDRAVNVRISGDGSTVAFDSGASDIVPGDTPGTFDIFTRDLTTNSVSSFTLGRSSSTANPLVNLSADGRFVLLRGDSDAFVGDDRNGQVDAFVYDRVLGKFELVTRARDGSPLRDGGYPIAMSGDGRVAVFQTESPELSGDGGGQVTCFSVRETN